MKINLHKRFWAPLAAGALALTVSATPALAAPSPAYDKVFGADRYSTSIQVAKRAFPAGAKTVYIARGDVLVDALAAGTLTDGPILLANRAGDSGQLAAAVASFHPSEVVAIGGPNAVPDALLSAAAGGAATSRLSGADRYLTAIAIADRAFPNGAPVAYIANGVGSNGQGSPDAVAGGALTDGPIILWNPNDEGLNNQGNADYILGKIKPQSVIALGGPGSISDDSLSKFAGQVQTGRLAGSNRYETAVAIADRAFPNGSAHIYVARADVFADAVAAGVLTDGPILLSSATPGAGANAAENWVKAHAPQYVTFLGGSFWQEATINQIVKGEAAPAPQQPQPTDSSQEAWRAKINDLINQSRAQNGAVALTRDPEIDKMAQAWTEEMLNTGNYEHSNGSSTWMNVRNLLGSKCHAIAENIDYWHGYDPAQTAEIHVKSWLKSPGHYHNLMNPRYRTTGIGVVVKDRVSYATQMFCG